MFYKSSLMTRSNRMTKILTAFHSLMNTTSVHLQSRYLKIWNNCSVVLLLLMNIWTCLKVHSMKQKTIITILQISKYIITAILSYLAGSSNLLTNVMWYRVCLFWPRWKAAEICSWARCWPWLLEYPSIQTAAFPLWKSAEVSTFSTCYSSLCGFSIATIQNWWRINIHMNSFLHVAANVQHVWMLVRPNGFNV